MFAQRAQVQLRTQRDPTLTSPVACSCTYTGAVAHVCCKHYTERTVSFPWVVFWHPVSSPFLPLWFQGPWPADPEEGRLYVTFSICSADLRGENGSNSPCERSLACIFLCTPASSFWLFLSQRLCRGLPRHSCLVFVFLVFGG